MISILIGILVTGAVFYIALLFHSAALVMLGYACAGLLVCACLFLAYRLSTVQCSLQVPVTIVECQRPFTVRISVRNRSILPCPKVRCRLECTNSFLKKKHKAWIRGGMALAGENRYDHRMALEDYGRYGLKIDRLRVYDLTGLFYIQKKVESRGTVQIFPKMQEVGIQVTEAVRKFYGEAEVYDDLRPGHDNSELFQVRPFRDGDKIQSIHWKLSIKTDELLVREDGLPKACPVLLLLDHGTGKRRDMEEINAYLVVLSSISFTLMDAGCPHYAVWYSNIYKDVVRIRVDDEESLFVFLSFYLEEPFQERAGDLLEDYKEKYRGENFLYTLEWDQKLELLKNKEIIEKFSVKDWEKKLNELEIVL